MQLWAGIFWNENAIQQNATWVNSFERISQNLQTSILRSTFYHLTFCVAVLINGVDKLELWVYPELLKLGYMVIQEKCRADGHCLWSVGGWDHSPMVR